MKKLLTLMLTCALLLSVFTLPANAEDKPVMQTLNQNVYSSTLLFTTESYPEVCLTDTYWVENGTDYYTANQLRFPCPEGTYMSSFGTYECEFIDPDNRNYYIYRLGSYAYETFLNDSKSDEYILADGSEGYAAYLDPASRRAYGLIGYKVFDKNTKLRIVYTDDSLSSYSDEDRIAKLSEIILNEIDRIMQNAVCEVNDTWWSKDRFSSVSFHSLYVDRLAVDFTLCPLDHWESENIVDPDPVFYPYYYDYRTMKFVADYNKSMNKLAKLVISLESYSYPISMYNDKKENASIVKLAGGSECYLYFTKTYEGNYSNFYASFPLGVTEKYSGSQLMLNLEFHTVGYYWTEYDDIINFINYLMSNITVRYDAQPDQYYKHEPYSAAPVAVAEAPVETAAAEPAGEEAAETAQSARANIFGGFGALFGNARNKGAEAAAEAQEPVSEEVTAEVQEPASEEADVEAVEAADTWTCPTCGRANAADMKFCPNDATPRPATEWTCPTCGRVNAADMKFCPNDASPRP